MNLLGGGQQRQQPQQQQTQQLTPRGFNMQQQQSALNLSQMGVNNQNQSGDQTSMFGNAQQQRQGKVTSLNRGNVPNIGLGYQNNQAGAGGANTLNNPQQGAMMMRTPRALINVQGMMPTVVKHSTVNTNDPFSAFDHIPKGNTADTPNFMTGNAMNMQQQQRGQNQFSTHQQGGGANGFGGMNYGNPGQGGGMNQQGGPKPPQQGNQVAPQNNNNNSGGNAGGGFEEFSLI